jgi:hypothetical protein
MLPDVTGEQGALQVVRLPFPGKASIEPDAGERRGTEGDPSLRIVSLVWSTPELAMAEHRMVQRCGEGLSKPVQKGGEDLEKGEQPQKWLDSRVGALR